MRMIRAAFLAPLLLLLLLPSLLWAQAEQLSRHQFIAHLWDIDSITEVTAVLGPVVRPAGQVETVGSSTTVTAVGSATPFATLTENARIIFHRPGGVPGTDVIRGVVAVGSSTSITISSAADLSVGDGYTVEFQNLTVAAQTDFSTSAGWFDCKAWDSSNVCLEISQHNIGGATTDFRIQCQGGSSTTILTPVQVYPELTPPAITPTYIQTADAALTRWCADIRGTFDRCRVVGFINTADDGADTGADREQVTVEVQQKRSR